MLSCKHTIAQGTDYLDKELGFWRKVEMKMHLMICVNCRRYVKQLKQTVIMLSKGQFKQPSKEQIDQLKREYKETNSKQ
ncbi:zf-HC2 domain-containing protein [Kangiella marina]|uniref:Putative zinc-finger domain-containing protein n=1 Tax=Kangiella marina TaxID=1079178 RepID=A0ABP8IIQ7_9GAMM